MVELSVCVPVYNASAYIRRGLDSLIRQKWGGIEIIVVDDGSTDDSFSIIGEYEREYGFIRAYKKQNEGVSSARNLALQNAKGKYVAFLDIDDEIEDGYYQTMLQESRNGTYDVIISGYKAICAEKITEYKCNTQSLERKEFVDRYFEFYSKGILMSVWNKLFKREIIAELEFELNRKSAEDYLFCLEAYKNIKSIRFLDNTGYRYYKHSGNTSNKLANQYNEVYELKASVAYRNITNRLYSELGVSQNDVFRFHCNQDYIWFYQLSSNALVNKK